MKKLINIALLSSTLFVGANAHEIWINFDEKKNEAKLYFGHFADNEKESGEKFARIKEGVVYPKDLAKSVTRNDDNITYTLAKKGDIVVVQEGEPRKNRETGLTTKRVAHIKTGRDSSTAITKFDIVPNAKNSNTFKLLYDGKALKDVEIDVISPTGWEKSFVTDENGEFTVKTPWVGTYLLQARYEDDTKGEVDGKPFDKIVNVITYTIDNKQGIAWETKK